MVLPGGGRIPGPIREGSAADLPCTIIDVRRNLNITGFVTDNRRTLVLRVRCGFREPQRVFRLLAQAGGGLLS